MSSYPIRRHVRLRNYDYAGDGAYFVTVCVEGRRCLLGSIRDTAVHLDPPGQLVKTVWSGLHDRYHDVQVDQFVIMPNHLHGILILSGGDVEHRESTRLPLSEIIRRFKTYTSNQYRIGMRDSGWPSWNGTLWQRNYHEHVIRNERDLNAAREYIVNNPLQWELDRENPDRFEY